MEAAIEGVGRILFHILRWVLVEALLEIGSYYYGWATLKVFTLGKYPKDGDEAKATCIVVGVISMILTVLALIYFVPV